jgi:Asp-tRNA(Asn)/Glu-tRNA(Gln) amidotransferase A subunit family amidase
MHTIIEIATAVRRGERRAVDVLEESLTAIAARNPQLNAFVHVDPDLAREAAAAVDRLVAIGHDPGLLAGVPFGIKDFEACIGMPTSHGSLLYKGQLPVHTDTLHVARLRAAGAVPVGKTACPEFGLGVSYSKAWGVTRNPWNLACTPGGSSCGSAAAVAAGLTPLCTSADYGGSTRIPAAWTGLVGLKPSHGRIPNDIESDFGCLGALTTTVADTARYLDVVAGPDDRDRMSLPRPTLCYERVIEELDVRGLRAAWSADLGFAVVEPEVAQIAERAAEVLMHAAELQRVDRQPRVSNPPWLTWLRVAGAERRAQLELEGLWPEHAAELSRDTRLVLKLSENFQPKDAAEARGVIAQLQRELAEFFEDADVLMTPTVACSPFQAEGSPPLEIDGRDAQAIGYAPFTMIANFCWNPAISVPAGCTREGLPVGVQIIGRRHADEVVLRLARIFERAQPWPRLAPIQTFDR